VAPPAHPYPIPWHLQLASLNDELAACLLLSPPSNRPELFAWQASRALIAQEAFAKGFRDLRVEYHQLGLPMEDWWRQVFNLL